MKKVILNDVADVINGFPCKKDLYSTSSDYIPIIRIQNMTEGFTDKIYYSGKYDSKSLVTKGDILFSLSGTIKVFIWNKEESLLNQRIVKVVPKNEKVNKKYLYYFLKSKVTYIAQKGNQSIINNVSVNYINSLKINDLALDEQELIVCELNKIDNSIENRKKALDDYNNLISSKFYEMFGSLLVNDKKWETKAFGAIIKYIADIGSNGANSTVSSHLEMKDTPDYAIMVRTVNLNANDFSKNIKYIGEETYNFFEKSKIFGGELIMNKIGSPGQLWIMPQLNKPISLGLNLFLMRLTDEADTVYIYYLLKSCYGKREIQSRIMGAVTKSITKTTVKQIPIYLPPINLQKKFALFFEEIEKQKELIHQDITDLEFLLETKMHEYFD